MIYFRKSDKGDQARGDGLDLGGQFGKIKDGLCVG